MISLILPYWDRQQAADAAFLTLEKCYSSMTDLEVIIVDDGNAVPFKVPATSLNVRVVTLPRKDKPTPQSRAWNEGVKAAHGDIVVLSCIEILHTAPVLQQMVAQLKSAKSNSYILASAWCPDEGAWHCHSTRTPPGCPEGTGQSYCGAMYREHFWRAGGFDEDYMQGAGYEDRDFIHRLKNAGTKFVIRDDLTVIHPKTGATIRWEAEGFLRNEALFRSKWTKPVTFLCLKAGEAYGPEYVNILHDMVKRNLSQGYPGRFVCMTDNPKGLDAGIDVLPLPAEYDKWWGKLYMFKPGLFKEGERVIFMDLDTVITGSLDEIAGYDGQFATLRDFYYPRQVGPAIICWKVGSLSESIWLEWALDGKPRHAMGDLWWINNLEQGRFVKKIDILQDLFPGKFCSFKADCNPYPPKGTSVVCFHGQPKPDNCMVEWVSNVWKIGGGGFAELEAVSNTILEITEANIKSACKRNIPWLEFEPINDQHAVIVSGGPSLKDTLPEILWRKSLGQTIIAVNGTAKYLNAHGITPDMHIIIDARPDNVKFIEESKSAEYILASQCDPTLFDAAGETTLFHLNTEGIADILPKDRQANLISSGSTVGLAAMAVAYVMGYRTLHLHGFDSSYETNHHAYAQKQNDNDQSVEVIVNGERFTAAPWMVRQAQEFQELATQLVNDGVTITVAGSGLLPHIARCMS